MKHIWRLVLQHAYTTGSRCVACLFCGCERVSREQDDEECVMRWDDRTGGGR